MNMIKTSIYKDIKYYFKSNEYYIIYNNKKIIFKNEEDLKKYLDRKEVK